MFELIKLAIVLIGSAISGAWDLKTTDIPDIVCILMIASAIGIYGYESYITGSLEPLMTMGITGGLLLAFGLIMYFGGQWGGGDGELLIATGMLVASLSDSFVLAYFLNVFIIGALYSILYSIIFIMRNNTMLSSVKGSIKITSLVSLLGFIILSYFSLFFGMMFLIVIFLGFFALKIGPLVEKGFYRKIKTLDLRKDDMLGEDIPKLRLYKKEIRGLKAEEVEKIRKYKRYVIIREGVRFGPVFFLSLVATYYFGNIILALFLAL